ncbi:acetoacetate--CoA ligase [Rhodococcus sp. NPDC060086]|uniref:acetoacetate--CoA ligase n=1 Tax=Rhodococcus sp. NPDC060086 TaxID=3347055 RepID=UPI0036677D81
MVRPQWVPSEVDLAEARVTAFGRFVEQRHAVELPQYEALWQWSIEHPSEFWQAVWDWFEIRGGTDPGPALAHSAMPGAVWFPGARLNYASHVFRNARADRPAIIHVDEDGQRRETSWTQLHGRAAALAATLREYGVKPGDRVVGYLPNIPEAIVALLATAGVGAVWSACGQDYAAPAALDRLGQLDPKILVTADGYRYNGCRHDRLAEVAWLRERMPGLEATVLVTGGAASGDTLLDPGLLTWEEATAGEHEFEPVPVPFDHPLWTVFSSGTTGLPKGIVHGHGGVLLEHLKALSLHLDIGPRDTYFWYTSPSWMMWNFLAAGLLVGATIVSYDGAPSYPDVDRLWRIAADEHVTVFGTSPGYVLACIKAEVVPRRDHDLSALRGVGVTGSALPPTSSLWLGENVGERVQVMSITGGTDVVSAFIGSVRTMPVWPGELSVPCLGVAVDAFDAAGRPVRGEVGELVVTAPMPSMPVRFWNDPDGTRLHDAYFSAYPGVWRHGDRISITERGSVQMHGRSDATLNRHGVRMGTADIYQVVEDLPEVVEALALGIERPDGRYWMPLFVVLADGVTLDEALRERIRTELRTRISPRHVPDDIIAAPGIPHTRTGKKLEVPIKRILQGAEAAVTVERTALDVPELIEWYREQS